MAKSRAEVVQYIKDNAEAVAEQMQVMLEVVCPNDCNQCEYANLCDSEDSDNGEGRWC